MDIAQNFKVDNLIVKLNARDFSVYNVKFNTLEATASLSDNELIIENANIGYKGAYANVAMKNNFKSNQFRFIVHGETYPMEISPWLPKWWTNIFEVFHFRHSSIVLSSIFLIKRKKIITTVLK